MSSGLMAIYLIGWVVALLTMMIVQHFRNTHEIISLRNLYLVGAIIYLLVSPILVLLTDVTEPFTVQNINKSAFTYCIYITVFFAVFLFTYSRTWPMLQLSRMVPVAKTMPTDGGLLIMAVALMFLAVPFRLAAVIPVIGVISIYASTAFVSVSAGCIGWVVGRRPLNVGLWMMGGVVVMVDMLIAIYQQMSRRILLAVLIALLWGLFYSRMRYMRPTRSFALLAILLVPPFILLAVYTSVRTQDFREKTSIQIVQDIVNPANIDIKEGIIDTLGGQTVGAATFWTIENYPENIAYRPLFSLYYIPASNIPRMFWPNKPYVYSALIAYQAKIKKANLNRALGEQGVTLPPGVIGFAAAEGGLYAVIIYAIFFSMSIRFLQNLVWMHYYQPLVVLAVGASLGTLTGLSRGDIALFYMQIVYAVVSAYLILLVFSKLIGGHSIVMQFDRRLHATG